MSVMCFWNLFPLQDTTSVYVIYGAFHFISRQKLRKRYTLSIPYHSHVPGQVLPSAFLNFFFFHWRCHINFQLSFCYRCTRSSHLKTQDLPALFSTKKKCLPCPVHKALKLLKAPSREAQGLVILAQQVPHVDKCWSWCKRRVTAFETWHGSNNGDNVFCAEEVHFPEGNMYCVSCHGRWKLLQNLGCKVVHVCSPGHPPFLSSIAAGQGRLANKQLNNIVREKFSRSYVKHCGHLKTKQGPIPGRRCSGHWRIEPGLSQNKSQEATISQQPPC